MIMSNTVKIVNANVKRWYIVKKKSRKQWAAYELTQNQIDCLKSAYEYRGPYENLITCIDQAKKYSHNQL